MSKRPFVLFGLLAVVCILLIPWFALGKEGDQDAATVKVAARDLESKDLFANNCGPCHTLAAAGTDGIVGPDLDQRFAPTGTNSAQSYEGNAATVMHAVTCGIEGRMPRGILEEEEAKEVSTFVAVYAGQIGKGPTLDTAGAKPPEPPKTC
jgi:mono/diheme cytochrome c family protein